MSATSIKVGEINESGFLHNLFRKGFSFAKSLSEIHANSIDAKATNITYVIDKKIRIIDDGCGMDQRELKNAFSMYNSNHSTEKSIGVSGLGYKPALIILSLKTNTMTVTRKPDGEYLTLCAPWKEIFEIGKYTDMITIRPSTKDEIEAFNKDREKTGKLHGTTTIFDYNEILSKAIQIQFENPNKKKKQEKEDEIIDQIIVPEDSFSVIFGRFPQNVYLINKSKRTSIPVSELSKYNYFGENQTEYYDGIMREKIIFMQKEIKAGEDERDQYLFIWESSKDGKKYVIKKRGTGWMKSAEELTTGTPDYEEIGEAQFICAQRKYKEYFDEDEPKIPERASKDTIHPYDKENIGTDNDEFLGNMQIYRNNQMLGIAVLPGNKISSARANSESFHKILLTHCALEYCPISKNDNPQDLVIGIQECKTQFNYANIPKNLLNLLAYMRNKKANEIWEYFKELTESKPEPVVNPDSSDSDSEDPVNPDSSDSEHPVDPVNSDSSDSEHPVDPVNSDSDSEHPVDPVNSDSDSHSEHPMDPVNADSSDSEHPMDPVNADSSDSEHPMDPVNADSSDSEHPVSFEEPKIKGVHILSEIMKFTDNFNSESIYEEPSYIELFNLLKRINESC